MTDFSVLKRPLLCYSIYFHIGLKVGSQKGPQKLKGLWTLSFWLVICVYFKVHTSHSTFQIFWSMKILLWSVNTDQDWILITSANSQIVVTNQFLLCNGSFSWKIPIQVITLEKSCHISAIECQLLIKQWSTKCPFVLSVSLKVNTSSRLNEKCPHPRSLLKKASVCLFNGKGILSRSFFHKLFIAHFKRNSPSETFC